MPAMPPWARGGRIVWDDELKLAFTRSASRRSAWSSWIAKSQSYKLTGVTGSTNLERARENVMKAIGDSIGEMVKALDPRGAFIHWQNTSHWKPSACGAPDHLKSETDPRKATCPECLAIVHLDVTAQAERHKVSLPEAKTRIVGFRTANKLAKLLGDDVITEIDF